jgi:maleate isomerase
MPVCHPTTSPPWCAASPQARPQAVVCLCTNFPAAVVAAPLEAELGLPVYDSTALGVWHALALCGVDTRAAVSLWGSLFGERV